MNMIWHDHEGMLQIMPENVRIVINRLHHHVCDGRLMQVERSAAGFVQQSIHGGKCLPRVERGRWKNPVGWQAVLETPGEEEGPSRFRKMGKSATIEPHSRLVAES